MPYPKTCHDFVAIGVHNSSKTFSKSQFLNMTIAATRDNAVLVMKQTKRIEAMKPPGAEKNLWSSCLDYSNFAVNTLNQNLDNPSNDPLQPYVDLSFVLTCIDACIQDFKMNNIPTVFPIISTNLTLLAENGLSLRAKSPSLVI
ncbi:hypothetical protein OSB04_008121 [Centaurea solstitialis]|uniref:Pectinesterase inhibitor domain-containing protein n=1 Tax=Centaurea solstitialis TaxID=347529 RepID=A0AA38TWN9_9ASTR|nr:hypothetical protein OSB04_008121 [Centaurea solstitialis]